MPGTGSGSQPCCRSALDVTRPTHHQPGRFVASVGTFSPHSPSEKFESGQFAADLPGLRWPILIPSLLIVGIAAFRDVFETISCSPPRLDELRSQEAFVLAHLSDAREFELGTADCDDEGRGLVNSETSVAPAAGSGAGSHRIHERGVACLHCPLNHGTGARVRSPHPPSHPSPRPRSEPSGRTRGALIAVRRRFRRTSGR